MTRAARVRPARRGPLLQRPRENAAPPPCALSARRPSHARRTATAALCAALKSSQRIAQMKAIYRTARTFDQRALLIGGRKRDHRAEKTFFQARGENANHALVPMRIE